MRSVSLAAAGLAFATTVLVAPVAGGDPAGAVASVFFVAKSENKNQVHYGIHVDASCAPAGAQPVFVYWRMLERGPQATEPLLWQEQGAYGVAEQRVADRAPEGGRVLVRLNALPNRSVTVATTRRDGVCRADATVVIGGARATLERVYAKLRWPFGVDYLEVAGRAVSDGHAVQERISP